MQSDKQFHTVLQTLQRPINCLVDQQRNIRKEGLNTIVRQIPKQSNEINIRLFTQTNLGKFINRVLQDKIEANRQTAITIIDKFTMKIQNQDPIKDFLETVFKALIARINNTPFPETSEQLRLRIVLLINKMVRFNYSLLPNLGQLSNGIAKCLLDPFPDLKKAACELIQSLSKSLKFHIGHHCQNIVKSLNINLTHQHSKVRKSTLTTIAALLVTEGAGAQFQHVQVGIKASLSDKIPQVRKAALECTAKLLNLFGPKYLKMHQASLVSCLLSGLSDQKSENIMLSMELLRTCGEKRKQLQDQEQGKMKDQS